MSAPDPVQNPARNAVSSCSRLTASVLVAVALLAPACKPKGTVDPSIVAAEQAGAWAIHEALETRILAGSASEADRAAAVEKVRAAADDGSAAYAYARAAVAGRLAELRGLQALDLIEEVQTWALKAIERDADFQGMAPQRMVGTLYVLAGKHLKHGDSEEGLEFLEAVVEAHPDAAVNHLRLAQGYIALGDPEPGLEGLCLARAGRDTLSKEEQVLLDRLVEDVGGSDALGCEEPSAEGETP